MGKNTQRLGGVLASRMSATARAVSGVPIELGTINGDLSLKVDSLTGNISPSEYLVDLRLTHSTYETSETEHEHSGGAHSGHELGTGTHTHDGGKHRHRLPSVYRRLQPGDRVLVAWAGVVPVVVAIVVAGTTITE